MKSRKRPWVAVLLALVYPGLGHVYLREWFRSFLWFGLVLTSSALLIPESVIPSQLTVETLVAASQALPTSAVVALLALRVLNLIDAYWLASTAGHAHEHDRSCPSCGKGLDPDLSFCHWCTERLVDEEPA